MKITLIAALLAQLAFTASASPLPNAEPVADAAAAADYGKPPRPVDYCLLACYPRDDPNFKCPKGFVFSISGDCGVCCTKAWITPGHST